MHGARWQEGTVKWYHDTSSDCGQIRPLALDPFPSSPKIKRNSPIAKSSCIYLMNVSSFFFFVLFYVYFCPFCSWVCCIADNKMRDRPECVRRRRPVRVAQSSWLPWPERYLLARSTHEVREGQISGHIYLQSVSFIWQIRQMNVRKVWQTFLKISRRFSIFKKTFHEIPTNIIKI